MNQELIISNKLMEIGEENIFYSKEYFHWCNSIIKGTDGLYHLFYSRWEKKRSFTGWLTHSEVAHAVSEHYAGPYRYVNTVLNFEQDVYAPGDRITAHNPKIKCFDGKYYLYFCSTWMDREITNSELIETGLTGYSHSNWMPLRNRQRTYVAVSDTLDGTFVIQEKPLLEPAGPIEHVVVNPGITKGHDGRYYLIIKGDTPGSTTGQRNQAIAVSDYPDRDFVIQDKPVIKDWDTEDMSLWYDERTEAYYAVFHAHTYIGMMISRDGLNWEKADDFVLHRKRIQRKGKEDLLPDHMERPFVYVEENVPKCLSAALQKDDDTCIVMIPIASEDDRESYI